MSKKNLDDFVAHWLTSIDAESFVRLTLSKPTASNNDVNKVVIKLANIKGQLHYSCTLKYPTKDVTKNYTLQNGSNEIQHMMDKSFLIANLFTTSQDYTLEVTGKGSYKLKKKNPTFKSTPDYTHDKQKKIYTKDISFLVHLGILNENGKVQKGKGDKLKQINKFIEIIAGLITKEDIEKKDTFTIYDMGAGRGYLTFALYEYFMNNLGIPLRMTGVESRAGLVTECNDIAKRLSYDRLTFAQGYIGKFEIKNADMVIALHACDTATDDAIEAGMAAGAKYIICSPCCHKQVRKDMKCEGALADITTHGILAERQAELVTDAIRALLLESQGYKTKVFEFISTEHTSKNLMIVGQKVKRKSNPKLYLDKVDALKTQFGIKTHYLESLLSHRRDNISV